MDIDDPVRWRNYFLLLLDRIPTPVAVCRANGEVLQANPAMAAEWGTVPGQVIGRNLLDLFRPRTGPQFDRLLEALRLGRRSRYPVTVRWSARASEPVVCPGVGTGVPPSPGSPPEGPVREGELVIEPVGEPLPDYPLVLAVLHVFAEPPPPVAPAASATEARILALAAAGATTAAIGKAVGLTTDGVNYHLGRLTRRWRVPNRTALVAKAYVLGVLAAGSWPPAPGPAVAHD